MAATAVVATGNDPGSPSYVMPAAFPTPYYSQFLPPYQNFNPFYPLPSVSYVGPHRQPFRQWAPYYYYGGPIEWGAGPASAAPNPPVTVGPAQQPSFLEVDAEAELEAEADETGTQTQTQTNLPDELADFMPAVVRMVPKGYLAQPKPSKVGDGESGLRAAFVEGAQNLETTLKGYRPAQMKGLKYDPIKALREKVRRDNFAKGALWADKFDKYWSSRLEKSKNKRIKELRYSAEHLAEPQFAHSFMELEAEAEAEAEAAAEADVAALDETPAAEAELEAETETEADAEAEAETETDDAM